MGWRRAGGGLAAGLTLPEILCRSGNAATGLKVAMMDANGEVERNFQDITNWLLARVTSQFGTTADFQNMMQMLVRRSRQKTFLVVWVKRQFILR